MRVFPFDPSINRVRVIFLVSLLLFLSGCPYESEFPLGPSIESVIDTGLLGKWGVEEPETDKVNSLTFYRFNEHEYYVEILDGDKVERFRAFITLIGTHRFLNYQEIGPETGKPVKYGFLRYTVSGDALHLEVLEDKLIDKSIATSGDLRNFVMQNTDKKELYSDLDILKRKK